jgi:cytochrome c biogenesis protein CcmG, thiol:disulfide interchange protein DsbE
VNITGKQRYILFSILLLAAGWAWILVTTADPASSGLSPVPKNGFPSPEFTLPDTQGSTLTLSNFRGKAVIVNFWATWCPPCRAEMPAMQRLYEEFRQQGLEILAVNSTQSDTIAAVNQFITDFGLTFPVLLDEFGNTGVLYQIEALPTTFFINREGVIEEIVYGGPMSEALLRIRVENILSVED